MSEIRTIEPDRAEDLMWGGGHVGQWEKVVEQREGETRWYEQFTLVLRHDDGTVWGLPYEKGLTEMQETVWPWQGATRPLELTRLYLHEVTTITYKCTCTEPLPPQEADGAATEQGGTEGSGQ